MEKQGKYKTKKMGRPALDHPRTGRLTVRWSDEDAARLERVRKLLSPRVEVSQGKAISAALAMAEELLLKNKSA